MNVEITGKILQMTVASPPDTEIPISHFRHRPGRLLPQRAPAAPGVGANQSKVLSKPGLHQAWDVGDYSPFHG